jgi:hypothetical protein
MGGQGGASPVAEGEDFPARLQAAKNGNRYRLDLGGIRAAGSGFEFLGAFRQELAGG